MHMLNHRLISLIHKSARIPLAPEWYSFYINAEGHKLEDHGEPSTYWDALSDIVSDE